MKLDDIRPGNLVRLDGEFTCHMGGLTMVHGDSRGLFFFCGDGRHYLDGQQDSYGNLVGVFPPDMVEHKCKCRCGGLLEFSAPSENGARVGDLGATPTNDAALLHNVSTRCDRCNQAFTLKIRYPTYVSMSVVEG